MKKITIALVLTVALGACSKKENVSQIVTASNPTVTLSGSKFYSIPVGGAAPIVSATAYDSTIGESYTPQLDPSGIDVNTPGLYIVPVIARNKYGYVGQENVYVAVTDIAEAADLSGVYARTSNGAESNVTELANGLYVADNLFGSPSLFVDFYFVQTSDSTIVIPDQATDLGDLVVDDVSLSVAPGDTSISYSIQTLTSNNAIRTFVKQ